MNRNWDKDFAKNNDWNQTRHNQVLADWVLYLVVATVTAVAVVGWLLGY